MDTQEGTTRKTSPNDANCVVWGNSTCFPFSFRVFFFTDLYLQVLQVLWSYGSTYRGLQREERAQTNAYRVVWAIRKCFFILLITLLIKYIHMLVTTAPTLTPRGQISIILCISLYYLLFLFLLIFIAFNYNINI